MLRRYLVREVARSAAAILAVCLTLFGAWSVADALSSAVNGLAASHLLVELVGLRMLVALEVLVPVSLFLGLVFAFRRLHEQNEFAALHALRVSPGFVLRTALLMGICCAVPIALLSLWLRPLAYHESHLLTHRAEIDIDVDAMQPGTFYVLHDGAQVVFMARRRGPGAPARDLFIRLREPDGVRVVSARIGYALKDDASAGEGGVVRLQDAHVYDLARPASGGRDRALDVREVVQDLGARQPEPVGYSALVASTPRLFRSRGAPEAAELEWRFTTPVTTVLLALLAVPLGRGRPREGRSLRPAIAVLCFFLYYVLYNALRSAVQNGAIGPLPGLWLAPLALGGLVLWALRDMLPGLGIRGGAGAETRTAHRSEPRPGTRPA
ncbi:MAG: LptF/LptG family permease [Gluconacetobacter diazotrophicus]|nr:LptF/LptG family permease [Gluconacetobacter diazotrophicus]